MGAADHTFSLAVPATKDHLSMIRLFGAAAAVHFGAGSDAAEDLRLALSEACAIAMADRGGDEPGRVEVVLSPAPAGVHVDIRTDRPSDAHIPAPAADGAHGGPPGATNPADAEGDGQDLGMDLLQALVSGFTIQQGADGSVQLAFDVMLAADAADVEDTRLTEPPSTPERAAGA